MEIEAAGTRGVYLYIACYNEKAKKQEAFIAVTKAILYNEVVIEMENLGDYAILFTSDMPISDIRDKLKSNKVNYLLIDLSLSYDLESVFGFLPDSKIEMVQKITKGMFSKKKDSLDRKLKESIETENFELAAPIRDLKKGKDE